MGPSFVPQASVRPPRFWTVSRNKSAMGRFARLLLLTLAPLLLFAACQREGTGERTGRSIDRGVDRMTR